MTTTNEIYLPKKTSIVTFGVADPVIPKGKYRAAIGFKFDAETDLNFVEYIVCQMMLDVQDSIQGSHEGSANLAGSSIFRADPKSGLITAIILWKDHWCFDLDIGGSRYMVADALSEMVWISDHEKEFLSAYRFVVWSKKQITRNMIKNFEKFMIDGEYAGKTYLLS